MKYEIKILIGPQVGKQERGRWEHDLLATMYHSINGKISRRNAIEKDEAILNLDFKIMRYKREI